MSSCSPQQATWKREPVKITPHHFSNAHFAKASNRARTFRNAARRSTMYCPIAASLSVAGTTGSAGRSATSAAGGGALSTRVSIPQAGNERSEASTSRLGVRRIDRPFEDGLILCRVGRSLREPR